VYPEGAEHEGLRKYEGKRERLQSGEINDGQAFVEQFLVQPAAA
jgi:hypothetical protein